MIRLFVESPLKSGQTITLSPDQVHYLLHVMRKKTGETILLFNGQEGEWQSKLDILDKKRGLVTPQYQTQIQKNTMPCILCPALIKKECMDLVLQKATELGVTQIRPVITRHTVVHQFNRTRALSIVTQAAEQSERLDRPTIEEPVLFDELLKKIAPNETLVYLSERQSGNKTPISGIPCFLIGPEGGFSPAEMQILSNRANTASRHLGQTILRAETACIAALACWKFKNVF